MRRVLRPWAVLLGGVAALAAAENSHQACPLPGGTTLFSIMSFESAEVLATQVDGAIAVGGDLVRSAGTAQSAQVSGPAYVGGQPSGNFVFQAGVFPNTPVYQALFPWALFEDIARRAVAGTHLSPDGQNYRTLVMDHGGRFTADDFGTVGEDGSSTMVIFNTFEDVALDQTVGGEPFSASVLAPFSSVVVLASVGGVNGLVVAKRYGVANTVTAGSLPESATLGISGQAYAGPLFCSDAQETAGEPPLAVTTESAVTAAPTTSAPITAASTTGAPTTATPTTAAPVPEPEPEFRDVGSGGDDGSSAAADKLDGAAKGPKEIKQPKTQASPSDRDGAAPNGKAAKDSGKKAKKKGKRGALDGANFARTSSTIATPFTVVAIGLAAMVALRHGLRKGVPALAAQGAWGDRAPHSHGERSTLQCDGDAAEEYGTFGWTVVDPIAAIKVSPSELVFREVDTERQVLR